MKAQEKQARLRWAIMKARDTGSLKSLMWAEKIGAVKGANTRRWAYDAAMAGEYEKTLRILEE